MVSFLRMSHGLVGILSLDVFLAPLHLGAGVAGTQAVRILLYPCVVRVLLYVQQGYTISTIPEVFYLLVWYQYLRTAVLTISTIFRAYVIDNIVSADTLK